MNNGFLNSRGFEFLDMINVISFVTQIQNMEADHEWNKTVRNEIAEVKTILNNIQEQNKKILERLERNGIN